MIELTIDMNGNMNQIVFEPFTQTPNLEFMLLPSARIGRKDDNVHLAPVAVHNFFNAILFAHWLANTNSLSESDAFSVYLLHDMFKPILRFVPGRKERSWYHARDTFFQPIEAKVKRSSIFDDYPTAFQIAKDHMQLNYRGKGIKRWNESTWYEQRMERNDEGGKDLETPTNVIALRVMLQPALSNIFGIEYVKSLFIESYVEALRQEYASVFSKLDAVIYRYEFADTQPISKDPACIDQDIELLCKQSNVTFDSKRLTIQSFIGAYSSPVAPDQHSRIRLPFWMLLVLHQDPTSIIFPVPVTPAGPTNSAFVDKVRQLFKTKLNHLFPLNLSKSKRWAKKRSDLLQDIDQHTFRILTGAFDAILSDTVKKGDQVCNLCGSTIHQEFVCSPVKDLGFSSGNYTDWHNHGDLDSCCALCAVSNFKIPPALEAARKLVGQRKLVYFAASTPGIVHTQNHLDGVAAITDVLPFFTAPITPKLVPASLESLVTLNVVAALFLRTIKTQAEHRGPRGKQERVDTRLLWLEETFPVTPFAFIGTIGKSDKEPPAAFNLLKSLLRLSARHIWLRDPIISAEIEVPFHALFSLAGVKNEKHFELKYKPLLVSNLTGSLPVIRNGFHFVDMQTLSTIEQVQTLLKEFRPHDAMARKRLKDSMTVTAIVAGPEEFTRLMIEMGGFNIEVISNVLLRISGGGDPYTYLQELRDHIFCQPIILEQWS